MSITSLPAELVSDICGYLGVPDWCARRLTCRFLFINLRDAFANRHFNSISVLVTSDGLGQLQELAAHDTLHSRVQELWIVPELFEGYCHVDYSIFKHYRFIRSAHNDQPPESPVVEAYYAAYKAAVADHLDLLHSDGLGDILTGCLKRFVNLTSIGIRYRPTSKRDGLTSLGSRRLRRQLGYHPVYPMQFHYVPRRLGSVHTLAFMALSKSLMAADRKVKKLTTCGSYYCGLEPTSLTLTPAQWGSLLTPVEKPAELHLCFNILQPPNADLEFIGDVLTVVAPKLAVLTFSLYDTKNRMKPCYFPEPSQGIHFTQLVELHLRKIEVTYDTLETFLLTAAPTLKVLTMVSLGLADLATSNPSFTSKVTEIWQKIRDFLRDRLSLRFLSIRNLFYAGNPMRVNDALRELSGTPDPHDRHLTVFDADRARVSFREWANQLGLEPRPDICPRPSSLSAPQPLPMPPEPHGCFRPPWRRRNNQENQASPGQRQ